jgi:hypothetical protein
MKKLILFVRVINIKNVQTNHIRHSKSRKTIALIRYDVRYVGMSVLFSHNKEPIKKIIIACVAPALYPERYL